MQTSKKLSVAIALFAIALLSVTLSSFSLKPGGDHFEVYLNKKLVFQQIVSQPGSVRSFSLDQRNVSDQVDVFYSHCGKIGTKRIITIKEGKNVLKQWRFTDDGANKFMSVAAKEILSFHKNGDKKLNLYYSSEELPDGKLLASIILDGDVNKALP